MTESPENGGPVYRRRASDVDDDRREERNLLAAAMDKDADLIKVVAANSRENVRVFKTQTYLVAMIGLMALMIAVMGVSVVLTIASTYRQTHTLNETRDLAQKNRETTTKLLDCIEPTGACFKRNLAATDARTAATREYIIAVGDCLADPGQDDLRSCVQSALAKSGLIPTPDPTDNGGDAGGGG